MGDLIKTTETLSIQNIILYLFIMNFLGFVFMWIDKQKAKKGSFRISEMTFFVISILGGSIGTLCGMYAFRHKTKKKRFTVGIPVILTIQIIFIVLNIAF